MIKIKVFQSTFSHKEAGNKLIPVADYYYCVYLFGILIHSVTIYEIEKGLEQKIFGSKIVKEHRL